jgi:hypothetical protein
VTGTLNIPIWQGGKSEANIAQAQAVLAQRQAELEDTRGQIEASVRSAYLDLEAASGQVEVARKNLQVAQETLEMTRARMEAGVINTVEVVQAQQTLSSAQLDLINSVFAHNLAKLSLVWRVPWDTLASNCPRCSSRRRLSCRRQPRKNNFTFSGQEVAMWRRHSCLPGRDSGLLKSSSQFGCAKESS